MDSPLATSYSTPPLERALSIIGMPVHKPAGMTVTHAPESTVISTAIHSSGLCTTLMVDFCFSVITLMSRFLAAIPTSSPLNCLLAFWVSTYKGCLMRVEVEVPLQLSSSVSERNLPTDPKVAVLA